MKIHVKQTEKPLQFEANSPVATISVGANQTNDKDLTFRPMELLLTSLASCSAIDVENILRKQKLNFSDLSVDANGQRKNAIPSVFESIHLHFTVRGNFSDQKLKRAIELTKEKYCSVYHMLKDSVNITFSHAITPK